MDVCLSVPECNVFTYVISNQECWLKTEASAYKTKEDNISGTRCNAAPIEEPLGPTNHYPEGLFKIAW